MQANHATGSPNGWVDVSQRAAGHGLDAQVCISRAAWMDAVYFVREPNDRLDPIRESWRMGRLLNAVCGAVDRCDRGAGQQEFTLSLEEGFDRLRSLCLPGARLRVRVEHAVSREVWVDVAGALDDRPGVAPENRA